MSHKTDLKKKVKELEVLNKILLEKITEYSISTFGNLCIYGHENLEHISEKTYYNLIKFPTLGILELVKLIHYDKKYPENHNITLDIYDDSIVHIFRGDKWQPISFESIYYGLVYRTYQLLYKFMIEHDDNENSDDGADINTDIKARMKLLGQRIADKDENLLKFMDEELKLLLMDYRKKIE